MNIIFQLWRRHSWLVVAIGFCLLLALAHVLTAKATARADNERIVTIYDGEIERTIVTDATTVEEALNRANVPFHEADAVEPALKSELIAENYNINVHRARPVLVVDGEKRVTLLSPYKSARQIVEKAEIPLFSEDIAELERVDDVLADGGVAQKVNIDRATPFTLILFGKKVDARTQASTVAEMLVEKNLVLQPKDEISVKKEDGIVAGMTIEIWRDGIQTVTQEEAVQFPIRRIEDKDRPVGYREIREAGVLGKRTVTYEINMQDRVEISRKELQSIVSVQPKEQVELVGTKPSFSGDFAAALAKLRSCEGGYNSWNPAGPYYGAYQFSQSTWNGVADPARYGNATPAEQDEAARKLYLKRGWSPWPNCGAGLPDIYR